MQGANGAAFAAEIEELGEMPESEMAEVRGFEELPEKLTYPELTPVLYERMKRQERPGVSWYENRDTPETNVSK